MKSWHRNRRVGRHQKIDNFDNFDFISSPFPQNNCTHFLDNDFSPLLPYHFFIDFNLEIQVSKNLNGAKLQRLFIIVRDLSTYFARVKSFFSQL